MRETGRAFLEHYELVRTGERQRSDNRPIRSFRSFSARSQRNASSLLARSVAGSSERSFDDSAMKWRKRSHAVTTSPTSPRRLPMRTSVSVLMTLRRSSATMSPASRIRQVWGSLGALLRSSAADLWSELRRARGTLASGVRRGIVAAMERAAGDQGQPDRRLAPIPPTLCSCARPEPALRADRRRSRRDIRPGPPARPRTGIAQRRRCRTPASVPGCCRCGRATSGA